MSFRLLVASFPGHILVWLGYEFKRVVTVHCQPSGIQQYYDYICTHILQPTIDLCHG